MAAGVNHEELRKALQPLILAGPTPDNFRTFGCWAQKSGNGPGWGRVAGNIARGCVLVKVIGAPGQLSPLGSPWEERLIMLVLSNGACPNDGSDRWSHEGCRRLNFEPLHFTAVLTQPSLRLAAKLSEEAGKSLVEIAIEAGKAGH